MNKKLEELLMRFNLASNGESHNGVVNGYQVAVKVNAYATPSFSLRISAYLENSKIKTIKSFIEQNKKDCQIATCVVESNGITLGVKGILYNQGIQSLINIIPFITKKLEELEIPQNCCPICGEKLEENNLVFIDGFALNVDGKCKEEALNIEKRKEEEFQKAPNNYLKGFVGVFLGALIGSLVWILIGLSGFISGWIAFLISFLGGVGYDLMKGKKTKVKVIMTSIVTFVAIIISTFVLYLIVTRIAMNENNITGSAFEMLFRLLQDTSNGVLREFITNLVLAFIFGSVGVYFSARMMLTNIHR